MTETEIEKLNQLVSRTDMSGNQKVEWLINFIEKREQELIQHDVIKNEVAVCECKDEWLREIRLNVMRCKKCGTEY